MKKVFYIMIAAICSFGFIGMVNAEEQWDDTYLDMAGQIATGEDLTSDATAKEFFNSYDVYYKYVKIDDTLYNDYVAMTFEGATNNSETQIAGLVPSVSEASDVTGSSSGWTKINASKIQATVDGISYDASKAQGYLVAIAAVDKSDNSRIYVYRGVYEVTSSNTLIDMTEAHQSTIADDTYTTAEPTTTENEDVATNSNPNTGLSDWAIYLVPLALISGSVLMFKRRYA